MQTTIALNREAFKQLIENPANDDQRMELFEGEICHKSRFRMRSFVVSTLNGQFFNYLQAHPIGEALISIHLELPDDDNMPLIDLAVLLYSNPMPDWNDYLHRCPEIVVEVEYPGQSAHLLARKAQYYLAHACQMVILLYPQPRIVEVITPSYRKLLTAADTLDGGDVLPSFTLPISTIFPPKANSQ